MHKKLFTASFGILELCFLLVFFMYSAFAIANSFIKRAKEKGVKDMTPMKLQKIMFYAQSHYLNINGVESPLFDDFFARWKHGPVIPSVYHTFKYFGSSSISKYATNAYGAIPIVSDQDDSVISFIDSVLDAYGKYSGAQLSSMTQQPITAWKQPDGSVITNQELYLMFN